MEYQKALDRLGYEEPLTEDQRRDVEECCINGILDSGTMAVSGADAPEELLYRG